MLRFASVLMFPIIVPDLKLPLDEKGFNLCACEAVRAVLTSSLVCSTIRYFFDDKAPLVLSERASTLCFV